MANRIKESNITPGAVTSDKIAPGTISASNITPGTITGTQIAPATVEGSNIAPATITAPNIGPAAITAPLIGPAAVGAPNISPGAITTTQISPTAGIVSGQIAPGTIANDRLANTGITINGTTIALGASGNIVAGTDWQSVITAAGGSNTASAGEGYFINTTSNTHTINLPSSPSQGDEVTIVDYAGTFGTNNVTVGRNGSNIDGAAADATLSTNRLNVRFVYIDATQGWRAIFDDASENYGAQYVTATGGTVTTSGDYKIHTFTGDGCFVVSCAGNPGGSTTVDYLVVAGGGGGGSRIGGSAGGASGAGAGGFRESHSTPVSGCYSASPLATPTGIAVSTTTYPITVGAGGTSPPSSVPTQPQADGTPGSNSSFSTITSTGGGGGNAGPCGGRDGQPGGSGGGGSGGANAPSPGGTGNTPPVSPPQGNNGGGHTGPSSCYSSAGGGGAGGVGNNNPGPRVGGPGVSTSITGSSTPYASGGDGGVYSPPSTPGINQPANSGKGGPAATGNLCGTVGGQGGKGIVVIRYKFQ